MEHLDLTNDQWIALARSVPPSARIIGFVGRSVVVRQRDGSGVVVDPSGETHRFDENAESLDA